MENKYTPVVNDDKSGAYHMGFVDGMLWATHNPGAARAMFEGDARVVGGIDLVEEAVSNFVLNYGANVTAYRDRGNAPLDILNMPRNAGGH